MHLREVLKQVLRESHVLLMQHIHVRLLVAVNEIERTGEQLDVVLQRPG